MLRCAASRIPPSGFTAEPVPPILSAWLCDEREHVAGLDAKTDDLVSMILDVRGRVRPDDLDSLPEVHRAQVLAAFAFAHGDARDLRFDGDDLVAVTDGAAGAHPPVGTSRLEPHGGRLADGASDEDLAALGLPDMSSAPGGGIGMTREDLGTDPTELAQTPSASPRSIAIGAPASADPPKVLEPRVNWPWWFLPIGLGAIGGGAAYLWGRSTNEKQVRRMLYVGVTLTLVELLVVVVLVAAHTFGPYHETITLPPTTVPTTAAPSAPGTAPAGP
jgi:hypothetical protein